MKKTSIFAIMLSMIVIFFSNACQKDVGNLTKKGGETAYVENERLTFDSDTDLSKTVQNLLSMNDEELKQWYKKMNFNSLWLIYDKAFDELETLDTYDDVLKFAHKYKDYFKIVFDENGEETIIPTFDDPLYLRLVNNKGEYAQQGIISIIIDDKIVQIKDEDYYIVEGLGRSDILKMAENDQNIKIQTLYAKENAELKAGNCGSLKSATYTRDEKRCKRDRKVILEIYTYVNYGTITNDCYTVAKVYGKRKFACVWGRYKTELRLQDTEFTVKYPIFFEPYTNTTGYDSYSMRFPLAVEETRELVSYTYYSDKRIIRNKLPYFSKVYAKATSRGVGNNWAIVNCN